MNPRHAPGNVARVDSRLSQSLRGASNDIRCVVWTNFGNLAAETEVEDLLARQFQVQILSG
jgi:hypothetical protein